MDKSRSGAERWSHPSVKALAGGGGDPIAIILDRARSTVLAALEQGWSGPPFDPIALAKLLNIPVTPSHEILDARTVPLPGKRYQIEFNPDRPRGRLRYSIAHEIAHTLFSDCSETVRHRHLEVGKDWELEMLCNLAAAEILMPIGSFPQLTETTLSIDELIRLRAKYDVSFEALFLRLVKTTTQACSVFCMSRKESGRGKDRYHVDYSVPSRGLGASVPVGVFIPQDSVVSQCTAIGTTSKGDEAWPGFPARVECVGIPPYPGLVYPRVIALAVPKKHRVSATNRITSLRGDATEPRGNGLRIVAHVVNDKAATWGAGFARVVGRKWPLVQEDFKIWAETHLRLGAAHLTAISDDVAVFHMVAQRGYGPSPKPRIRYGALSACLRVLADVASDRGASVHIPRIGCGQAGGDWAVVSELIDEHLCRRGVAVSVYDLPGVEFSDHAQRSLPFRDV